MRFSDHPFVVTFMALYLCQVICFEWDPVKERTKQRKRYSVGFDIAQRVFDDPNCFRVQEQDRI